jgi:hypothetical protein
VDDPRRVTAVATGLARFHAACHEELRRTLPPDQAITQATEMVGDLYRDIAVYLAPVVAHARHRARAVRLTDLPVALLDALQADLARGWPGGAAESEGRVALVNAYEQRRKELDLSLSPARA